MRKDIDDNRNSSCHFSDLLICLHYLLYAGLVDQKRKFKYNPTRIFSVTYWWESCVVLLLLARHFQHFIKREVGAKSMADASGGSTRLRITEHTYS